MLLRSERVAAVRLSTKAVHSVRMLSNVAGGNPVTTAYDVAPWRQDGVDYWWITLQLDYSISFQPYAVGTFDQSARLHGSEYHSRITQSLLLRSISLSLVIGPSDG